MLGDGREVVGGSGGCWGEGEGVQGQACQVDMGAVKPVGQHKLLNTTKLPEI